MFANALQPSFQWIVLLELFYTLVYLKLAHGVWLSLSICTGDSFLSEKDPVSFDVIWNYKHSVWDQSFRNNEKSQSFFCFEWSVLYGPETEWFPF